MKVDQDKRRQRERGSSMIELCFTIPTLLFIAGATIDMSRYMRYAQITTFVSQETASQIYRKCSDITIYEKPNQSTIALKVNSDKTKDAVRQCIETIQAASQLVLNQAVGGPVVNSHVFRWDIEKTDAVSNCGSGSTGPITDIEAKGTTTGQLTYNLNNFNPLIINNPETLSGVTATAKESAIEGGGGGGKIVNKLTSQTLVTTTNICNRGRIVTVEVAYAFKPIVKFLPQLMIKLDEEGRRRDISIL